MLFSPNSYLHACEVRNSLGSNVGDDTPINNNNSFIKIQISRQKMYKNDTATPPCYDARSDMQTTKLRSKINENSTPVHRKNRQRTNVNEGRLATAPTKQQLQTSD